MTSVAKYSLDDGTVVEVEVPDGDGFRPASAGGVAGNLRQSLDPVFLAARTVLDRAIQLAPDEIAVTFGVKASGDTNWLVAKASAEANFEVTLTWKKSTGTSE